MTGKPLPFTPEQLRAALDAHPTPFYLYDERGIRAGARSLRRAFAWSPGFREYFAVKATPNPHIMAILADEGCGMDCASLAELALAGRIGLAGESVMFTSNNTPPEEYRAARRLGAIINLDDAGHLEALLSTGGGGVGAGDTVPSSPSPTPAVSQPLPDVLCFRYNPGPLREGNAIIGRPAESKFGSTREQLRAGYALARERGVRRFGLHTMLASNELDPEYFVATARMLFALAADLHAELGLRLEFVNLGGGIGIPYRPEQRPVDLARISAGIRAAYAELVEPAGLAPLKIFLECGRLMTGPYGVLVTRVRHLKRTYRSYAGVDATMADLMRPGMYGAYHHITVLGKEGYPAGTLYDVTGSLCENNDKFAVQRPLPELEVGDVLVIHDAGAHGRAMGFNYNGRLRCAELLLGADGAVRLIRRAETLEDYFATLV
ncbi:MAG TPA: diaminopimelate decarboxylase [Roseiflexaceae bacterium]|nr:diaminopimelate decarboxylase [Roseiflexaceae bacterium]